MYIKNVPELACLPKAKYVRYYEYYDGQLTLGKTYKMLPCLMGKKWLLLVNDKGEKVYYKVDNFDVVEEDF